MHQIEAPAQYARYLQENPHEIDTLFRELLISVTSFFRDSEAFDSLATGVLPNLLKALPDRYTFRVWSPGCATGEEVFSLAILLRECMNAAGVNRDVQIFGTDLDHRAIDTARAAKYPEGIVADISRERLDRYFVATEGGYRVCKEIRDMTVFAVQNLVKDPPFTKLDLLSCRNLLIYLNADLQRQLIPMFHYALRPHGILFLGSSETIGGFTDLFDSENKKWKTFRRKDAPPIGRPLAMLVPPMVARTDARVPLPAQQARETTVTHAVDQLLLAAFAPPSVVITERGEVIYIHGRTGAYLEPSAGKPRLNILDMAREGLQLELAAALREAADTKQGVTRQGIRVRTNGGFSPVDFTIITIDEPEAMRGLLLVTFRPHVPVARGPKGRKAPSEDTNRVERLERELLATKVSLQSSVEDLETSNEELKSTNEELQSTNEEMQSANEELETSREEMQPLNEELTTVNAELLSKVEDLSRANDDMQNLLNSVAVAVIFLDTSLKIVRYTDQARQLAHLIPSDVGRPIEDLTLTLAYEHLVADCRDVLRTLVIKQVDVQTRDGQWYLGRILPYRTAENVIAGLVLSFVNISSVKEAETGLRRMAAIVRDSNDAITVQTFAGAITAWNRGAESMHDWTEAEALQLDAHRHIPLERRDEMAAVVRRIEAGERVETFATERRTRDGRVLHVRLTATALVGDRGRPVAVATTERLISDPAIAAESDSH